MITQTFEQAYKIYLKSALEQFINDKDVIVANDVTYKAFQDNSNSVIAVIQSGGGTRAMLADITDMLLNITFICDNNYLQDLLMHLNQLIDATNGVFATLSCSTNVVDTDKQYTYVTKWKTPTVSATPVDIRVENNTKSMKVVLVTLQGNLSYANGIEIDPLSIVLKINNSSTKIINCSNIIVSYDSTNAPQYKSVIIFGYNYPINIKVAEITTYSITLLRTTNVKNWLLNSAVSSIDLSIDGGISYIPIATYQIVESYQNGTPSVQLVLSKGNVNTIE